MITPPEVLDAARAAWRKACAESEQRLSELRAAGGLQEYDRDWTDFAYDHRGSCDYQFDSLRDLADAFYCGADVHRVGLTHDSHALQHYARNGGPPFDLRDGEFAPDEAHHWVLLEDTDRQRGRAPRSLADRPAAMALAAQWRESHRGLRGRDLVAFVAPGKQVAFAVWSPLAILEAETRTLAWELSGNTQEPRFRAVRFPFKIPEIPDGWWRAEGDDHGIYLPAEHPRAAKSLAERKAAAAVPVDGPVLLTGLDGIDSQFYPHVGGLTLGSLVVIGGQKGQGKTTLALHFAEQARAAGWFVLWIAIDERTEKIEQRLAQRRGAVLEPEAFYVLPQRDDMYEALAEQVNREAGGRPTLIVVDSLQRLRTVGGEGAGAVERITAAIETIAECQERWPSVVVATSEIARGSLENKGSSSIDYLGTMGLRVARDGDDVSVAFTKNRDGHEEPFKLALDRPAQRLLEPAAAARAKATAELRALIVGAVRRLGVKATSQNAIAAEVEGVDSKRVHAEIKAMATDGALLKLAKGYAAA